MQYIKYKLDIFFSVILGMLITLLCGCDNNWTERTNVDAPWSGPDQRVRIEFKVKNERMMPSPQEVVRWVYADGTVRTYDDIHQEVLDLLIESAILEEWPLTGSWMNSVQRREAPYNILLVSVSPVVLLLIDCGENDEFPEFESGRYKRPYLITDYLTNKICYGTSVPQCDKILLLIKTDRFIRTEVPLDSVDEWTLKLPDGKLIITQGDTGWKVIRQ